MGERLATSVNGTVLRRFRWLGKRLLAVLDGSKTLTLRYLYAGGRVPVAVAIGDNTYLAMSDHLGSIRVLVDTVTGSIGQQRRYDVDGRTLADTTPGLHPLGFAGGLTDEHTGLVHFANREY